MSTSFVERGHHPRVHDRNCSHTKTHENALSAFKFVFASERVGIGGLSGREWTGSHRCVTGEGEAKGAPVVDIVAILVGEDKGDSSERQCVIVIALCAQPCHREAGEGEETETETEGASIM